MKNQMDEKEKKTYVSLYKKDTISYSLTLCAIIAELVYVISILDVMAVSFWMGVTVMVNIAILFILFTCAVKMNVYSKQWAMIGLAMAVYMVVRQFVLIPFILKPYGRQLVIGTANLAGAVLIVSAGVVSIRKTERRNRLQERLDQTGQQLETR